MPEVQYVYTYMYIYIYIYISNCPAGQSATVPGIAGSGTTQINKFNSMRQLTSTSTYEYNDRIVCKPTNQQSSRATGQPPTSQQNNRQLNNKVIQKLSKNHQKTIPNRPKIDQKSTKMAPKLVLEGLLGGSWGHLGPKRQQEPQKCVRPPFAPPSWRPTWRPKSTKNR